MVSGCSKSKWLCLPKTPLVIQVLIFQERIEVGIITMRIAKIHTMNVHMNSALTAKRMNVMSATPVTP